jgi:hypothetical protein
MSVTPSPIAGFAGQFFDNNGQPLSGGKIFTYAAGTTLPQATFTSASGTTPHANPIILNSAGRVPGGEIWLTDSLIYKFVIETATNVLIGTFDNITGVNSNFVNYTVQEEVITATAGQTVFNLSTITYTPGTNSLSVYIDGVNQYVGDSYLETDGTTVTFTAGLHVGAEVKFTTAIQTTTGAVDASIVSYDPPFTGSVITNVEDKLAQYVSVKDFGAVGDGVADDTTAMQAAAAYISANGGSLHIPTGTYFITDHFYFDGSNIKIFGDGIGATVIKVGAWVDGILIAKGGPTYPSNLVGVVENITIEDLTIDGNRDGYVNGPDDTYGNGVNIVAADPIIVRNVEVRDAAEQSIVSTYWQLPPGRLEESIVIDSCVVYNPPANRIAIGIEGRGRSAKVTNNTVAFSNNAVVGIYVGHQIGSGADNGYSVVANNIINGSGANSIGVKIEENMYNITVANNVINGCDISIRASSDLQSTFGYSIIGNQCIDWSSIGIAVYPMKAGDLALSLIANNRILSSSAAAGSRGIVVDGKAHCVSNLVYSAVDSGIKVLGDNCLISNNEIDVPSGFSIDFSTSNGSYVHGNKISRDVNVSAGSTFFMNIGATVERTSKINLGVSTYVSGNAEPVSGTWQQGDIVFNSQAAAGANAGWICVTSGTPGTWKTFGAIAP